MKAGDDGRLKVPVEMKPDRLRNLFVGWLEVAMANIGRSCWHQGWKHLPTAEEYWLDVVFEARSTQQPMAGRAAALELAPEADDIDPVDEAEHDEVDEALLADDPEDEVLPDEVGPRFRPRLRRQRGGDGRR